MKNIILIILIALNTSLLIIETTGSGAVYAEAEIATASLHEQLIMDLTELNIEQLMDIEITSVSKREQKLSETASAVFVITQEDIRRSGFTSIPEALRMVPGLQVAHINSNVWAVSARGFNNIFSNKLLVMIDGRNVYTPLFAGVYWEVQDTLLEDVDRIEIVAAPALRSGALTRLTV